MPLEIANLPRGLSSLLALKQGGRAPGVLADTVAPTIELLQPYLLNLREYVSMGLQTLPVVGSNSFNPAVSVPAGELWYCWAYLVAVSPGAGEAADIAPALAIDGNPLTVPLAPYVAGTAGQDARSATVTPFWAGPGSEFKFVARSLTLQPDVFGAAIVTKLKV